MRHSRVAVAVRSQYGRCTVAARSPHGRRTVAAWKTKRIRRVVEKGNGTILPSFNSIVRICFVFQAATVRRPCGDRTATVQRPCGDRAAAQVHGQRTVNVRSTYGQRTVNARSPLGKQSIPSETNVDMCNALFSFLIRTCRCFIFQAVTVR